ncbi:UNVERIFIED_CONTAM: hypothetical protein GTU68_041923 [Idotea baltica]|nr:hypothetical protein [Idotea baltica]
MKNDINQLIDPFGLESYSFLLGWYNSKVQKAFHLPHHEDTVAFTIISKPAMFEKAFLPYLTSEGLNNNPQDPLDQCMRKCLGTVKSLFPDIDLQIIHDFELTPLRRPKILMQTAGHISGAARFYQRSDVGDEDAWGEKKIFGVSIHHSYGGWFAFRAVIILNDVLCKDLKLQDPM